MKKWIDFKKMRSDAYNPISLLTVLLFAYAKYGYAFLCQLENICQYVSYSLFIF